MKSTMQNFFLATTAALMLITTAGAAHATGTRQAGLCDAPNACNYKTQILKPNPRDDWAYSQAIRTIYLAAGTYSLRYEGCLDHATASTYLPAGTYSWRNLLDPKNGYYHQSVVLDGPVYWSRGTCDWQVFTEGSYTWGTSLSPVR
ncbi:hypothetical protein [Nonomuraea zeae]|uniref:Peptidase inhibitor family I36 protein n=1 Tax=Nonomuraea zeae TaxID=1642303 RepID=A0A5S4H521_9ACTN|nr:hypothetical protein [Nonomuraea zeae]TMR39811.1 hypothetical protein ETD85_00065 [Nonomuraea zeae]